MYDIFENPRYLGKHVIIVRGKVYSSNTGEGASRILRRVDRLYPNATPEIAYLFKGNLTV